MGDSQAEGQRQAGPMRVKVRGQTPGVEGWGELVLPGMLLNTLKGSPEHSRRAPQNSKKLLNTIRCS